MTTDTRPLSTDELDLAFALARGREAGLVKEVKKALPVFYYCHETAWQSTRRDAVTLATFATMIGLGVICNSSAMQWTGALIFFMSLFARSKSAMRTMTPDEIRADLLRLETGTSS